MLDAAGFDSQTKEPENRKSGYSSVHLVINILIINNEAAEIHQMELQVRDIFEEAWGEIDFTLRYVTDREDGETGSNNDENKIIENWKPHLNALKTFADGCSQHASLIKINAIDSMKLKSLISNTISGDTTENLINKLKLKLPKSLHHKVEFAFNAVNNAENAFSSDVGKQHFEEAAIHFDDLLDITKKYWKKKIDNRDVHYVLSMGLAYSIQPKNDEERKRVMDMYLEMEKRFSKDCFAYYRHGNAEIKRANFDGAIELLKIAHERVGSDDEIQKYPWVASAVPRQLGYAYWKKANGASGDIDEKNELLLKAHELAEEAQNQADGEDKSKEYTKALNNRVYYQFEYIRLNGKGKRGIISKKILRSMLKELEGRIDLRGPGTLNRLHTLAVIFEFLGDLTKARAFADQAGVLLYDIAKLMAKDPKLSIQDIKVYLPKRFHHIYADVARLLVGGDSA